MSLSHVQDCLQKADPRTPGFHSQFSRSTLWLALLHKSVHLCFQTLFKAGTPFLQAKWIKAEQFLKSKRLCSYPSTFEGMPGSLIWKLLDQIIFMASFNSKLYLPGDTMQYFLNVLTFGQFLPLIVPGFTWEFRCFFHFEDAFQLLYVQTYFSTNSWCTSLLSGPFGTFIGQQRG